MSVSRPPRRVAHQGWWLWGIILFGLAACARPEPLPTLLPTVPPPPPSAAASSTAPPPTPTATTTPAPSPTQPTATPTMETPTPASTTSAPMGLDAGVWVPVPLQAHDLDWAAYAFVARAMSQTERGRHYLALYQQHRDEWLALQAADEAWARRTHDLFKAWEPVAQALMLGQGEQVRLTPGLVAFTQAYLDELRARASPGLAATIQAEWAYIPWGGLGQATVNAAWAVIMGAPPPLPATPSLPPGATPVP